MCVWSFDGAVLAFLMPVESFCVLLASVLVPTVPFCGALVGIGGTNMPLGDTAAAFVVPAWGCFVRLRCGWGII